jgi:hypothetical protein
MTLTTKWLTMAIPAVVGIGIAGAVILDERRVEGDQIIPAGTTLEAELEQAVSADASQAGDQVRLRTVAPLELADGLRVPAGSEIRGVVTRATSPDWGAGPPQLGLRFTALIVRGVSHAITTEEYQFGTLEAPASGRVVLPAGERLRIRLARPVTIE